MLAEPDVQCVAICDVQASRREAGKKLVDEHYGNKDCALYRDFRELLGRQGHRRRADRHRRPLARAGVDPGGAGGQGRLQREALRPDHRRLPGPGRHHEAHRPRLPGRHPAPQRAQLPGGRASWPTAASSASSTRCTPRSTRPRSTTPGCPASRRPPRDVVDWDLWLGPAPWRPYNQAYVSGGWRGYYDFDSGARLLDWGAHTVDLCQWANKADDTMPIEYEPSATNITARYANGVKLVLDFLKTPFGERPGWVNQLGTCPVRFVGDEGWVETGDSGGIEVAPAVAQERAEAESIRSRLTAAWTSRPTPATSSTASSRAARPAANPQVMRHSHIACHAAALSWMLNRKLTLDPARRSSSTTTRPTGCVPGLRGSRGVCDQCRLSLRLLHYAVPSIPSFGCTLVLCGGGGWPPPLGLMSLRRSNHRTSPGRRPLLGGTCRKADARRRLGHRPACCQEVRRRT